MSTKNVFIVLNVLIGVDSDLKPFYFMHIPMKIPVMLLFKRHLRCRSFIG